MHAALLATTTLLALAPAMAGAQAITAPTDVQQSESQGLEEIIVTAQRRAENLQRAAVAVSAVQGTALVNAGITEPARLTELVPALTIQPGSTGNLIFLRGVGNFTLTPNSDPAIAFNYDSIYIGRPSSTNGLFFDLERVEVLKGPQGTLYGRNATGGAINVIPTQPKLGDLSGYVTASYGNYDAVIAEGAVNVPFGEDGALRVSASTARHDGYLSDGLSDEKTTSGRIQLKAQLTPDLTVRVAGDYAQTRGAGLGVSYVTNYIFNPITQSYITNPSGLPLSEGIYSAASQSYRRTIGAGPAGRFLDDVAPYPFQNNEFYGANAQIDYDTGVGTLTIIPAWRFADQDYLAEAAAFPYRNREQDEQFSIEARFAGTRIGMFDYTLGTYYYDDSIKNRTVINLSAAENFIDQRYTTSSFAPFGRLTAHLTDTFRVVGGLRYTKDKKTFRSSGISLTSVCLVAVAGVPTCPGALLFPTVDSPSELPFPIPSESGVVPQPTPGAIIVRADSAYDERLKDDRITYRVGAEYDLAPQSLVYATLETGYRSGGFSGAVGFETYEPEYITAYTVGMKNRLLDNRLQLNLEAFWWEYKDQQVSHVGLDLTGRTAQFIENIGRSRIRGVEVEGRVLATPTTLLGANVQYLDSENLRFEYLQGAGGLPPLTGCAVAPAANPAFVAVDCGGLRPFNSPRWTINLSAQQTFELGSYNIVMGLDTQYKSDRVVGFEFLPEQHTGSTWMTNAQVSFSPASDEWSISAFVRNIENNRYAVASAAHPISNFITSNSSAPRLYGVRGSIRF